MFTASFQSTRGYQLNLIKAAHSDTLQGYFDTTLVHDPLPDRRQLVAQAQHPMGYPLFIYRYSTRNLDFHGLELSTAERRHAKQMLMDLRFLLPTELYETL